MLLVHSMAFDWALVGARSEFVPTMISSRARRCVQRCSCCGVLRKDGFHDCEFRGGSVRALVETPSGLARDSHIAFAKLESGRRHLFTADLAFELQD